VPDAPLATPPASPTAESVYLVGLAERVAAAYVARTAPRAVLLTGSAATGEADAYSDLDLIAYYDRPPTAEARRAAGEHLARELGAAPVDRPPDDWYAIHGVLCEVGHLTVAQCEGWLAQVLEAHDPAGNQQALIGLLQGVALHGEALIAAWQARAAAYPEALARATVARHLRFLPVWWAPARFAARDASLFFHQSVVEACLNVLGVLAGLNRRYYAPVYFKRMGQFVAGLRLAPPDVAQRIERVLAATAARPEAAAAELEALVAETVALVEAHLPEVDTAAVRRDLGQRLRPWTPMRLEGA
jgi:Nucleotidyltransferase domain